MDREKFLGALKRVQPALGRGDLLPQLSHLWFDGQSVSAFDDCISISVPLKIAFKGGVAGDILTSIVDRAGGDDVEISLEKQAAHFKVGRTNLKLGIMDIQNRPFIMPERDEKAIVDVNRVRLEEEVRFCIRSIGNDVTHPEWCGITFEAQDDQLVLFSGYSQVLARAAIPAVALPPKFKRIILHEKFCKQIIEYPSADLELYNGHALLIDESGVMVYGRAITGSGGLNLQDMVDVVLKRAGKFVRLPVLHRILQRASVFEGDHLNMTIAVVDENEATRLRMVSEAGEGRLVDYSAALKAEHPKIEVMTNAKHLLNGAELLEFTIGKNEIIMRDGDTLLIVSVSDK